jgi:putative heme-binding domain-containing protein
MERKKKMDGATRAFLRSVVFVLCVLAVYIYIAGVITEISGQGDRGVAAAGVGPEQGREVFFGKGKCSTCHSLGTEGSAVRCPNLGATDGAAPPFDMPIIQRAELRAKERTAKTGQPYAPTDYILESHFDPGAYVVEGYKNEMPVIWKPPIALSADEEVSVDSFLQSLGGEVDLPAITGSPIFAKIKAGIKTLESEPAGGGFALYLTGDAARGEQIFFDPDSPAPCAKCHTVKGQGGKVGPELTNVAGSRTPQYIVESVLEPSKEIASGFEPYLVETKAGDYITGVKKGENAESFEILDDQGELRKIPKADIHEIVPQKISIMPGNFREVLTMEQFHDVIAFLLTLT